MPTRVQETTSCRLFGGPYNGQVRNVSNALQRYTLLCPSGEHFVTIVVYEIDRHELLSGLMLCTGVYQGISRQHLAEYQYYLHEVFRVDRDLWHADSLRILEENMLTLPR